MKILHLEDNQRDADIVRDLLESAWPDCSIRVVVTREDYLGALASGGFDLILSDYQLPGFNGMEALLLARERAPDLPFIFFSGTIGEERAIEAVRAGAADYVIKDRMQRLPLAIQRVVRDAEVMHARRRAEEELARERYLMRMLMENLPDSVYFKDAESRFIIVSDSLARRCGLEPGAVRGMTDHDLFSKERADEALADERQIMRTGESIVGKEEKEIWRDGRVTWVSTTKLPLRDSAGTIVGTFGISHDITQRKRLEEQALRSQRLEAIGTLAGGVAHDLNNTLAPIMMGVEMLREQLPGEEEVFSMILNSTRRGAEMVRLLLTFARGSEGERVAIPVDRLVKEVAKMMKGTFPKTIKVNQQVEGGLPSVLGDPTQLHQVLLNLCVNARDAMPDGGVITLEADVHEVAASAGELKPGRYVALRVRDNGAGIPPEIMGRIMDPFFTTKKPDKGTGLGLSTVVGIVKGHGGHVYVESRVGFGSTFTVLLPVAPSAPETPAVGRSEEEMRGNGEMVLFVDDEPAVRDVARAVMRRLNYKPLTATDGSDALIQALLNRADLRAVITDAQMPHMSGIAFVRAFRKMMPGIPVGLASGRLDESEQEEFEAQGVVLRLDKPFGAPQLAQALKTLLASAKKK